MKFGVDFLLHQPTLQRMFEGKRTGNPRLNHYARNRCLVTDAGVVERSAVLVAIKQRSTWLAVSGVRRRKILIGSRLLFTGKRAGGEKRY